MSEMDMEEPEFKAKQLRFEYSTDDLIAELEKRRPTGCPDKCQHLGSELCGGCYWSAFLGEDIGHTTDNFKADKAKEGGQNGK